MIASLITTYNRPWFLERTIHGIVALGARVLVVDDGSDPELAEKNKNICDMARPEAIGDVVYMRLPENRGLAASLSIGLDFWLVDNDISHISYFQDDVAVDPLLHRVLLDVSKALPHRILLTGHDAQEHRINKTIQVTGHDIKVSSKASCRATHMFAHRDSWKSVMPIKSKGIGFPRGGEGSNVDWWITRDHPKPLPVWCVPGLVRTFAWKAEDSCWGNKQVTGNDNELSRDAIRGGKFYDRC